MYNYFENTNNCKNIFQFDIVPPHTSIFYLPTDLPPKQTRKVLSPLVYLVHVDLARLQTIVVSSDHVDYTVDRT